MNSAVEVVGSAEAGRQSGDSDVAKVAAVSTLVFWIVAHLYRFTNANFAHDALMVVQDDVLWQMSLGRFLQPLYVFVRGAVCAPMPIGVLQLVFLTVVAVLIVRMLGIRSRLGIVLTCGVIVTNASIALTNATYLPWVDIFALALLLNVAGVCVAKRSVPCVAAGACLYAVAMALYQPYFAAAVVLSMLLVIRELVFGTSLRQCGVLAARLIGALALGVVVYFLLSQVALHACGIELSSEYNSLSSAWDFEGASIVDLLAQTWLYPITYMACPMTVHVPLCCCCAATVVVAALAGCVRGTRCSGGDGGPARAVAVALLVALLPFGAGIVYFISKGTIHSLMLWQLHLVYVFGIMVWDREIEQATNVALTRFALAAICLPIALVLVCNVAYSNDAYLKKDLEYDATMSVVTRIVDRMEQEDGYMPGETPVAFVGQFTRMDVLRARPGLDMRGVGLSDMTSITYLRHDSEKAAAHLDANNTLANYFTYVLAYPVNRVDVAKEAELADLEEVRTMPSFPAKGSVSYVGDVLVVKLADK